MTYDPNFNKRNALKPSTIMTGNILTQHTAYYKAIPFGYQIKYKQIKTKLQKLKFTSH